MNGRPNRTDTTAATRRPRALPSKLMAVATRGPVGVQAPAERTQTLGRCA